MMSKPFRSRLWLIGLPVGAVVLLAAGFLGLHSWFTPKTEAAVPAPTALPVKVIRPRLDPNFKMTISQPCFIEPYFQVELEAQVAGPIRNLDKDIGSYVRGPRYDDQGKMIEPGEALLTIDAPDLEADVAKKEALVEQRKEEQKVAQVMLKVASTNVKIARKAVGEKEAQVKSAAAEEDFRKREAQRFGDLAGRGTVTSNIADERNKYYEVAVEMTRSARAALEKANADVEGAVAKEEEASANIDYQKKLVAVAEKDLDVARAKLGFATLRAPFDGRITRRMVHPGSFVRNSSSGQAEPLLHIERSDIVTIYMNLPDTFAPFINKNTEAEVDLSELPGVRIVSKMSRWSPSLITPSNDRTMRVEVDLWNRGKAEYEQFLEHLKQVAAAGGKGLRDGQGLKRGQGQGLPGLPGVLPFLPEYRSRKDPKEKVPAPAADLTPGMYGQMRLSLEQFQNAHLIPSNAIYSQGGSPYLYLLDDKNVAHLYAIDIRVDDGKLALVSLIDPVTEAKRDLTDRDVVVASNQGELSEGQVVRPTVKEWGAGALGNK